MFEYVVLRRSEGGSPITAGQIAEALLFYQKVQLVIDRGTLFQLIKQIGVSRLLSLTQRGDFSAMYSEENLGTVTNSVGPMKVHGYAAFTLSGNESAGPLKTVAERLQFELERLGNDRSSAKKFAKAFLNKVPVRKFSGEHFLKGGIPEAAKADLLDSSYAKASIRRALSLTQGGYDPGDSLRFDVLDTALGTYVFDNIDFERINSSRAAMSPALEPLTTAHLLSHLLDARADIALAAHYGGDFITSAVASALIQIRHSELLRRTSANLDAQRQFSEIVLPDMPTVAEAIDSGERTFEQFLVLLDKSARFKHWVKSTNPDEGLVREYIRAVSSEDWIQTKSAKSLRYIFTAAIDATNPIAGVAAGIADSFFVEKLFGGWRPNHFVSKRLEPFLTTP